MCNSRVKKYLRLKALLAAQNKEIEQGKVRRDRDDARSGGCEAGNLLMALANFAIGLSTSS